MLLIVLPGNCSYVTALSAPISTQIVTRDHITPLDMSLGALACHRHGDRHVACPLRSCGVCDPKYTQVSVNSESRD